MASRTDKRSTAGASNGHPGPRVAPEPISISPDERYRDLLRSLTDAIVWEAAADTDAFTFVSDSALDVLGYPVEQWLSEPDFWAEHIHPADRAFAVSALQRLAEQGGKLEQEYRMLRADGEAIWLQDRVSLVRDSEGRPKLLRGLMIDITERKAADEELSRSEQRFSAAFNGSPAAMTIVRVSDRRLVDANDTFLRTLGYSRGEVLGRSMLDLDILAKEDRRRMGQMLEQQGRIRNMEMQLLTKSGEKREIIGSAEIVEVAGEHCVLSLFYDVTDSKLAQRALSEAESKYRSIFENAVFGIFQTTPDGRFVSANHSMARILGYASPEELQESVHDIANDLHVDPRRRAELAALLEAEGEAHDFQCQLRRKDGVVIWVSLSGRLRRDDAGVPVGYEGIVEDITDHRRVQDELRSSEERFRAIVGQATAGVAQTDLAGRFTFVNQRYCEMVGRDSDELLKMRMQDITHPDDLPRNMELFTKMIEGKGGDFSIEKRYVRPDRTIVWSYDSVSALRDATGTITSVLAVCTDITERKATDAALQRRYEELEGLHALTSAINSVISGEDIHTEAINAVMNTIHPDRAALLLVDASGEMRFKAWRGLSAEYRAAVDGHSPWSAGESAPSPVLIYDVAHDPSLGELQDTVLREGIHALAFVPLTAQDRLIGKFMLYYDSPHVFQPEEVQLAQTVANNLALALARRSAQEAVLESELRYRRLIEGVGVAVYTTDAEGRITLYNDAAAEMWGRRPAIGRDLWCGSLHLFHADGTPMAHDECPMALTLKEGRPVLGREALLERPDGKRVPFIPFPTPIRDAAGNLIGAVNVLVDISDRKRAEEALEAERERISNIIANVPGVVFEVRGAPGDPDQSVEFVSDYVEQMLGYAPEEWLRDPGLWHKITHPDDRERALAEARQIWAGERGLTQYRAINRDGRTLWIEAQSSVVRDTQGTPVGIRGVITDVSLRKAADEAREKLVAELQAERTRIDNIISDVPGVVWEAYGRPDSARQRIDFVSDYVEGMLGYTPEEWLSTPNFWLTIVHPEDRERAAAEATATFNSGESGRSEFRWVGKDGRVVWVDAQSTVIKDETGAAIGMRGVTTDITTRKRAEEALLAVQAQLTLVTNAVPALISYVDADHRYVYNNEAYADWFGLDPEELRGKHLRDALGERVYKLRLPYIKRALAGEVVRYEEEIPYENGRRWVFSEAIPHRVGGRVDGFVSVITDITERKKREDQERLARHKAERQLDEESALTKIAELLRTTLDMETLCQVALSQALSVTRTELGVMAIRNGDGARMVCSDGDVPESALEPFQALSAGGPTHLARALFEGKAAFSPRARLLSGGAKFLRESGATRFAVVPLIASGAIVGAIEIAGRQGKGWSPEDRDFLRRIADHIALAVDNAQAYQSIEDAYKRRDEGVRALAHEIRTPLTAIKGFSQLALKQVERGTGDIERLKDSMQEIAGASERLVRVAEDMLSAATVESGITRLRKERISLGIFLRDAVQEFTADERRPCPVVRKKAPRASVEIDVQLIRQVLWNLLSNAMKHSPQGEPVVVEATTADRTVTISVTDRGPGVADKDREHLFEKFKTGSTTKEQGLGLGLYVARQIVEAHGGKIWCESADGRGASFQFSLPVKRSFR